MANIMRMSVHEFEDMYDDEVENVSLKSRDDVKYVHVSDNEENPYVGCEYYDGTCSIVGCGMDRMCSFSEMLDCLSD